ncbi:hypothetical protein LAZ67_3000994 [Cordylochernes scorpioides]|uniref:Uncharacterized protein n=1 Tax=Cordylochernes scorpioides TaxID=51811 RepID=A0ABY6K6J6_9ARAC|nr:hypothetical protein LAZ67_3000994 [Cordylochernes scorpioides]
MEQQLPARMSLDVTGVFFTRYQLSAWKSGVINCLGFWAKRWSHPTAVKKNKQAAAINYQDDRGVRRAQRRNPERTRYRVKKPLEPSYEGPFPVLERTDKYFTLKVKEKNVTTSIDRLRPAYLLADSDNITAEHPTATRPIVSGALPSTSSQQNPDPPDVEKYTEFQGTGSAPDLPRTRSGRIIKKPHPAAVKKNKQAAAINYQDDRGARRAQRRNPERTRCTFRGVSFSVDLEKQKFLKKPINHRWIHRTLAASSLVLILFLGILCTSPHLEPFCACRGVPRGANPMQLLANMLALVLSECWLYVWNMGRKYLTTSETLESSVDEDAIDEVWWSLFELHAATVAIKACRKP